MEPVQIKLYGLFPLTKRRYLRQLVAMAVLLTGLFGLWFFLPMIQTPPTARAKLPTHVEWALWLLGNLHWIVFGLAMLVLVEALIVLRLFARREGEQAAGKG